MQIGNVFFASKRGVYAAKFSETTESCSAISGIEKEVASCRDVHRAKQWVPDPSRTDYEGGLAL